MGANVGVALWIAFRSRWPLPSNESGRGASGRCDRAAKSNFRHGFSAGDFLFAPAGVEHRFVNFTDNFYTWVIFYGPEGGEANTT